MSSDQELLLFAAKAFWADELEDVSIRYDASEGGICYIRADNQDHNGADREFLWNPLENDHDAFRLAVKLRLYSRYHEALGQGIVNTISGGEYVANVEDFGGDECAATRRAIVRAAAEIGRALP